MMISSIAVVLSAIPQSGWDESTSGFLLTNGVSWGA